MWNAVEKIENKGKVIKNNKLKVFRGLFLLVFFVINILSPYSLFISFEKHYSYKEESAKINLWKIETFYKQEASLYNLVNRIEKYKRTWEFSFDKPKDLVVFKFDRTKFDVSDIKIITTNEDKKIISDIDNDWDERILLDRFAYSEPILVNQKNKLTFSIESKNKFALEQSIDIVWVDVTSFSETISWKPDWAQAEDLKVIPRSEWWADETLRYKDNAKWVAIFDAQKAEESKPKTARQLKQEKKISDIRTYLATNFPADDNVIQTIKSEKWHDLVWPEEKTTYIKKIIIHHTAESMDNNSKDDESIMRSMYYYHTITRWWWDIWYNYVIWKTWKIYEWRAWWDYTVAAHALWNNKSTVWISVMWNFQTSLVWDSQKVGVEWAIWLLAKKYWIDVNQKSIWHKECSDTDSCLLKDFEVWNLSWHKDVWYTACPWANLYSIIQEFRDNGKLYSAWLIPIANKVVLDSTKLSKWPNIKIRLSYTWSMAEIKSYSNEKMKLTVGNRSWYTKLNYLRFEPRWTDQIALVVWKKSLKIPFIKISSTILEVSSWSRKPSWDKSWLVNDNKFRWSISIINDNWKLVLINELPLEDYLKWIAEISNDENEQKAKTILVAARSYALWYTDSSNRKFPWKPYDWSDNPDEFQKYLGYSFELRWTNIGKYVDDTNLEVIKYNGKLIKPWYFNQSNWRTKSYKQYCEQRKTEWSFLKTMTCEDIPYLQSVDDPAWNSVEWFKWHWVWISWGWAKFLAEYEGMSYEEIIKYFLNWVTVEKTQY